MKLIVLFMCRSGGASASLPMIVKLLVGSRHEQSWLQLKNGVFVWLESITCGGCAESMHIACDILLSSQLSFYQSNFVFFLLLICNC